ncbi:MAG: GNAT family N-acetyltransferase [Ruminococcus sp.]|nr:GNAT family N-acetyltransferase [Ruminococcus sp.]
MQHMIQVCSLEHIRQYGEIYAKAFSGEPWNDNWKAEDAQIHVREIMESKQSYGLEYLIDGEVVGFILGSSMLFHYGRTFEINDLAVHPDHQGQGIAKKLLTECISEMKRRGIAGVHLITQHDGFLPEFYERYGFKRESEVMLMGMEL